MRILTSICAGMLLLSSCAHRKLARKTSYMQRTYAELKSVLNEADVTVIEDSVKLLFPRNVMFDYNEAVVRADFFPVMSRFAGVLNAHDKTSILIVGHTDSVGGADYNLQLSSRRADSARAVLQYGGVAQARLSSWGLGTKMPIATNATPEGRQQNRRVEFIVLYDYKKKKEK